MNFVFGLNLIHFHLDEVQKLDEKLPAANEYLLLSGSCKDGTLDVEIDNPSHFARLVFFYLIIAFETL